MGYHRDNYMNLIRFVKKMIHLKSNAKTEWEKLRMEIIEPPQVAEKKWLLRQMERDQF